MSLTQAWSSSGASRSAEILPPPPLKNLDPLQESSLSRSAPKPNGAPSHKVIGVGTDATANHRESQGEEQGDRPARSCDVMLEAGRFGGLKSGAVYERSLMEETRLGRSRDE